MQPLPSFGCLQTVASPSYAHSPHAFGCVSERYRGPRTKAQVLPLYVLETSELEPALKSQNPTCPESVFVLPSFLKWEDTATSGCPPEALLLNTDQLMVPNMEVRG